MGLGEDAREAGEAEDSGGAQGAPPGVQDLKARAPTQGAHENRWTKVKPNSLQKAQPCPTKIPASSNKYHDKKYDADVRDHYSGICVAFWSC